MMLLSSGFLLDSMFFGLWSKEWKCQQNHFHINLHLQWQNQIGEKKIFHLQIFVPEGAIPPVEMVMVQLRTIGLDGVLIPLQELFPKYVIKSFNKKLLYEKRFSFVRVPVYSKAFKFPHLKFYRPVLLPLYFLTEIFVWGLSKGTWPIKISMHECTRSHYDHLSEWIRYLHLVTCIAYLWVWLMKRPGTSVRWAKFLNAFIFRR